MDISLTDAKNMHVNVYKRCVFCAKIEDDCIWGVNTICTQVLGKYLGRTRIELYIDERPTGCWLDDRVLLRARSYHRQVVSTSARSILLQPSALPPPLASVTSMRPHSAALNRSLVICVHLDKDLLVKFSIKLLVTA